MIGTIINFKIALEPLQNHAGLTAKCFSDKGAQHLAAIDGHAKKEVISSSLKRSRHKVAV